MRALNLKRIGLVKARSTRLTARRDISLIASFCTMAALALGAGGCTTTLPQYIRNGFKVGPNYAPPPLPLTAGWIDENNPRVRPGDPNLVTWWEVFDDAVLNDLVQRSLAQNLTLRAAGYQILQAQAARSIAVGELFPQTQAFGFQATRVMVSRNQGSSVGFGTSAGAGLAPSASLSGVPTSPSTPIAGVTPPANPSSPTSGASPTVPSNIGGSVSAPGGSAGSERFFTNFATSLNAS